MGIMLPSAAGVLSGAAAGAAGTSALNTVTYLDMVLTGRGASSTPEQTVEKLSDASGIPVPGTGDTRQNRISGLGPLLGLAAGVGVGAVLGLSRALGLRPGPFMTMVLATGGALIAGNAPMTVMGVTNPAKWSGKDWLRDILPHMAYGAVAAYTVLKLEQAPDDND